MWHRLLGVLLILFLVLFAMLAAATPGRTQDC